MYKSFKFVLFNKSFPNPAKFQIRPNFGRSRISAGFVKKGRILAGAELQYSPNCKGSLEREGPTTKCAKSVAWYGQHSTGGIYNTIQQKYLRRQVQFAEYSSETETPTTTQRWLGESLGK